MSLPCNLGLPPINDPITGIARHEGGHTTPIWRNWFSDLQQLMSGYFTTGLDLTRRPVQFLKCTSVTTVRRDEITGYDPGTIIFNSTTGKGQMYDGTVWQDLW